MSMSDLAPYTPPSDEDLRRLIRFSVDDGRIWLAGQRMLLVHAAALAALRRELIASLGTRYARQYFMRVGFTAGRSDAALAKTVRHDASFFEKFMVGPQLHMLEGAVRVRILSFAADEISGRFYTEVRWDHSWEAEMHRRDFGLSSEPVCWMLLGYASGYTSAFMGRRILYRETACVGCGHDFCHIVGKPLEEWGKEEEEDGAILFDRAYIPPQVTLPSNVRATTPSAPPELIGRSPAFRAALELLRTVAPTRATVLLTGETGVGKERFARLLHKLSPRAENAFIAVNCAAIPFDLIEAELFGVERGAYTGAHTSRSGRFELAHGGTLFLDEIGELPLPAQAKQLRVLQESEIERLGGGRCRKIDVRIVAATNRDLEEAVREGRFRADLFYRLNVVPIHTPPLRERGEDIQALALTLLQRFANLHNRPVPSLTDRAYHALLHYDWPGNVRELENLIERLVITTPDGMAIDAGDLFPDLELSENGAVVTSHGLLSSEDSKTPSSSLMDELIASGLTLEALERKLIEEAVQRARGNLSAAARLLGLTRPQLSYRWERKYAKRA
ncbi:MAG: sigma 54-interacting transcriptional regulator [Acidobacteriia bacterium]|nr:sigma 54-interacting transcriptional regulator [Methyloceanibacter sp.]MCL6492175.1 sigma 54-interacting transcriptional regulator [Terriglobia bacterium]